MKKIAIDVVLLPDEKMSNGIIEINKKLLTIHKKNIVLGKKDNQPHISLCMGAVHKFKIYEVIQCIDAISTNFSPFDLQGKLSLQTIPDHENMLWLEIEKTESIQKIHEVIMKNLFEYLNYDIQSDMFVDAESVDEETISYIKQYARLHEAPLLFNPHVTIGFGDAIKSDSIVNFSSSEIAIFQLGNYCTCKKLIYKTKFN